jgi:hypothetical protein
VRYSSLVLIFVSLLVIGCSAPNSLSVSVGSCGTGSYPNEPCITVSVCAPGTGNCTSIPNVLLDTGSYGLRIFESVAPSNLVQVTGAGGGVIAECSPFADGSSEWGPVVLADVQLGGEKAPSVPIQIVNSAYAELPSNCTNPDTSPAEAGYNGIIGVGPGAADCGATCEESTSNQMYYSCLGGGCQATQVTINQQVSNPVAFLPIDNNGISINLPAISPAGSGPVSGTMLLGIGTQSNNQAATSVYLPTDANGNFTTTFGGATYSQSFIDSGSNAYFFPPTSETPECSGGSASGLYCPPTAITMSATQMGYGLGTQEQVPFQIIPALAALATSNRAFNDLGGEGSGGFDWGLPFFYGKTIYVIMTGKTSSIGPGPGWAY